MITIVLPTYNERDNITKIISDIFDMFEKNSINGNIIVVDDSSPDGTAEKIREFSVRQNDVFLIERPKKIGLGSAYIEGFKKALKIGSEYVFEMDADLSHSPADIPRFLTAAKENDLVLGSRYIKGGKIENWTWFRRLISRGGAFYAKAILGVPINDLTSGYKCFRSSLLNEINFESAKSDGYSFQIELTYRAYKKRAKIKEIPITFRDRRDGKSKFSRAIFWEAIWMVWRLRFGK